MEKEIGLSKVIRLLKKLKLPFLAVFFCQNYFSKIYRQQRIIILTP